MMTTNSKSRLVIRGINGQTCYVNGYNSGIIQQNMDNLIKGVRAWTINSASESVNT